MAEKNEYIVIDNEKCKFNLEDDVIAHGHFANDRMALYMFNRDHDLSNCYVKRWHDTKLFVGWRVIKTYPKNRKGSRHDY